MRWKGLPLSTLLCATSALPPSERLLDMEAVPRRGGAEVAHKSVDRGSRFNSETTVDTCDVFVSVVRLHVCVDDATKHESNLLCVCESLLYHYLGS